VVAGLGGAGGVVWVLLSHQEGRGWFLSNVGMGGGLVALLKPIDKRRCLYSGGVGGGGPRNLSPTL